jgi:hypothetical protein
LRMSVVLPEPRNPVTMVMGMGAMLERNLVERP